jgi:hypothetical protein
LQGVSKISLQWYSKGYSVASVTKTFTLKGVQTIHRLHSFKYYEERFNFIFKLQLHKRAQLMKQLFYSVGFAGYVAVCLQLYCRYFTLLPTERATATCQ